LLKVVLGSKVTIVVFVAVQS